MITREAIWARPPEETMPRHSQDFQVMGNVFKPRGAADANGRQNGQAGSGYETRASPTLAHV